MIHIDLLEKIREQKGSDEFLYPFYGEYSIAEIVPSLLKLFNLKTDRASLPEYFFDNKPEKHKKTIMFMVDGLGFDHFVMYQKRMPFFERVAETTDVFPITSVFPSTTPAALTTIHTGLTPQEHGLPEFTVYFEELKQIIATLPFKPFMTGEREALMGMGGQPTMLYQGNTVYQDLRNQGVKPYVFILHEYAHSAYSTMTQAGAHVVPFSDYKDLFRKLNECLLDETEPSYFFVYWSQIDSVGHAFGPHSPEHISAMETFSHHMMEDFLGQLTAEQVKDVMYMMVADHGHVSIKGEDIIFLNNYLPLEHNYLRINPGESIHPTGAPHDVFLHIYEPRINETVEFLKKELDGKAEVITTKEALFRGFFGTNEASPRFLKRIGDVLILPYRGYHVWYKHFPDFKFGQKGTHGGLTEEEMIVPFAVGRLSDMV